MAAPATKALVFFPEWLTLGTSVNQGAVTNRTVRGVCKRHGFSNNHAESFFLVGVEGIRVFPVFRRKVDAELDETIGVIGRMVLVAIGHISPIGKGCVK